MRHFVPWLLERWHPSLCDSGLAGCLWLHLKPFGLGRSLLLGLESAMPLCQAHTWNTWLLDGGAIGVSDRIFGAQVAMFAARHGTLKALPAHSFVLRSYFLWGVVGSRCCCCYQSSLAEMDWNSLYPWVKNESSSFLRLPLGVLLGRWENMHGALHLISLMSLSGRLPYNFFEGSVQDRVSLCCFGAVLDTRSLGFCHEDVFLTDNFWSRSGQESWLRTCSMSYFLEWQWRPTCLTRPTKGSLLPCSSSS